MVTRHVSIEILRSKLELVKTAADFGMDRVGRSEVTLPQSILQGEDF